MKSLLGLFGYSSDVRASPPQPRAPYISSSAGLAGKTVALPASEPRSALRQAVCWKISALRQEYIPPVDLDL